MMLRYPRLTRHPTVFRAVTGLDVPTFDRVVVDVAPRVAAAEARRLARPDRRRAIGGGPGYALDGRDRVLLTVVWLRVYPTYAVLGYLFGVSEATALRCVQRVLPHLEAAGRDTMRLPDPGKGGRRTLDALLAETPGLAVIVDTFEQRVQRPQDRTEADGFSSGKKKQHTLKSQVVVDERNGRLADVAASVRGPTADITLLKTSGLLDRLDPEVGAAGDLAYVGIGEAHPTGLGATPRRKPRGKPRPPEDEAFNTAFARRRIVVEHTIRRLRCYQALAQIDRRHRRRHTMRVVAVAGLVNQHLGT